MTTRTVKHTTRTNPYIGPRAFLTGEKLYGRERELRELLNFLLSQRIVLLYSPSGAGKTSLVQAGLIPSLESRGFTILPVIRVNLDALPPSDAERRDDEQPSPGFNRYLYSALLSLEEGLPEGHQTSAEVLARLTLDEYLDRRPRETPATNGDQPQVEALIFDQFEEVLTIDPIDQPSKVEFFTQLGDALRNRQRWALFSMREDYVAALDPFLRPIPTHLSSRYRLDLLGAEAARQAIVLPARDSGLDFTEDAAMKLVDDLRRVQVQRPDGSIETLPGLYVEPVQLQVVCNRLWHDLSPANQQITEEDIDQVEDVSQSLREYYADEVAAIAAHSGQPERAIRAWIDRWLITDQGFRNQVLLNPEQSEGENRSIQLLEDAHLVRAERRRGATWIELAHDRLVDPIRQDNSAWMLAHLSALQRQAVLWEDEGRPEGLLFSGETLIDAQTWSTEHYQTLTAGEREFLQACELAARRARREKTTNRVIRLLAVGALIAAFMAILFGARTMQASQTIAQNNATNAALAAFNGTMAIDNASLAITSQANAAVAQAAATDAFLGKITAQVAEATAQVAFQKSEEQRIIADDLRIQAQDNAALANSRQFAAQTLRYLNEEPGLAALYAIEAYLASDTYEARDALLTSLMVSAEGETQDLPVPTEELNDITSVSLSPDGQHIAFGTSGGSINVWDYLNQQPRMSSDCGTGCRVTALDWSPNGQNLAYATGSGSVFLLDMQNTTTKLYTSGLRTPDLSFSPDGRKLAACVGNSLLILDLATGSENSISYNSPVESVDWAQDGSLLALGFADNTIQVIHQDSLETSYSHIAGVESLRKYAFSPWQKKISVAWDPSQPDNRLLAYANQTGKIALLDIVSDKTISSEVTDQAIYNLAFASDGSMIVSGGESLFLTLWRVPDLTLINDHIGEHSRMVVDLDFSPLRGEPLFASASYDNLIGIHKFVYQQPLVQIVNKAEGEVIGIDVSPDTIPQSIRLDAEGTRIGGYDIKAEPSSFALNAAGSLLALGYPDGSLEILDIKTKTKIGGFQAAEGPVLALTFAELDQLIFSWCEVQDINWAGDALCEKNALAILDTQSGDIQPVQQNHTNFIHALAFEPGQGYLASGSDDDTIRVRSLRTDEAVGLPMSNQRVGVAGLAFSPDGRLLASANADQTVTLWDTTTQHPIGQPFTGFGARITSLAFASDSLALYAGLEDGSLLRLNVDPHSWIARNCELAGRSLSEAEWSQFYPSEGYQPRCG